MRVMLACDFFPPSLGGVEVHILSLALHLCARGHTVSVLTRSYAPRRAGLRYLSTDPPLRLYYLPLPTFWRGASLPTAVCSVPFILDALRREQPHILHVHQAVSSLAHEAAYVAQLLAVPVVYTDHSLVGSADAGSAALNMMFSYTVADSAKTIAVSECVRENMVLRASNLLPPEDVAVVPNAIVAADFDPCAARNTKRNFEDCITIVVLSRLVYRKGIDLVAEAIPLICQKHPNVRFVIGGDGPKRLLLAEMREKCGLQNRVELAGEVPRDRAPLFLAQGDVFLNCSLTEGFCIAVVEAAAAGLLVVTTSVGGIPEALPEDMCLCAPPETGGIVDAIDKAIERLPRFDRMAQHNRVAKMYNWDNVASRTETVYREAKQARKGVAEDMKTAFLNHCRRKMQLGPVAGPFWCFVAALDYFLILFLLWLFPDSEIDHPVLGS